MLSTTAFKGLTGGIQTVVKNNLFLPDLPDDTPFAGVTYSISRSEFSRWPHASIAETKEAQAPPTLGRDREEQAPYPKF